jgi:small subunit ribosomal protein S16
MIKIRLARYGNTNRAFFRVVVLDEQKKTTGKALEVVGMWDPIEKRIDIDKDKVEAWVKKGAILSDTVAHLIKGELKPKKVKKGQEETKEVASANTETSTPSEPEVSVAEEVTTEATSETPTTEPETKEATA